MPRSALLVILLSSLFGCVATRSLGENQPCPCAPGWSCDTSHNVCVQRATGTGDSGTEDAGGTSALRAYAAAEVQAALAQCELPHGPVVAFGTFGDKRAYMLGAWIECHPSVETVLYPAIVFFANGTWQHLLDDGNGGLVPGYGAQNEGTYALILPDDQPNNANPWTDLQSGGFSPPQSLGYGYAMTFETAPIRMHVLVGYNDQYLHVWHVRLPSSEP
jgi:hypothetical protein